ncbi:MAG TPA: hypothetical protein ENI85_18035 [Deltaproteobacteria bacterium]|nr:hypothetical protein [Deltaproteobacteria bacterium]
MSSNPSSFVPQRPCRPALLAGLLGLLFAPPVLAQFSMVEDRPPRFEWSGRIEAGSRNEFKTETSGGDTFESWRVGVAGELGGPINESILVGIRGGYRYANYDFRLDHRARPPIAYGSSELPHDPWGALHTFDVTPNATILVGDVFSVIAAVPIRWSAENGARRNAFSAGISAIGRWQVTDDLRIGLGIGITSQLEEKAETFPLVVLDWQISKDLEFRTQGRWTQGGRAALLWGPNPAVRLSLSAGYERNRFRLDDNGFAADRNGIGEIRAVPVEIGMRLRLHRNAYLDFRAGLGFAGRFRVETDAGRRLYDERYDPAPRISLALVLPLP